MSRFTMFSLSTTLSKIYFSFLRSALCSFSFSFGFGTRVQFVPFACPLSYNSFAPPSVSFLFHAVLDLTLSWRYLLRLDLLTPRNNLPEEESKMRKDSATNESTKERRKTSDTFYRLIYIYDRTTRIDRRISTFLYVVVLVYYLDMTYDFRLYSDIHFCITYAISFSFLVICSFRYLESFYQRQLAERHCERLRLLCKGTFHLYDFAPANVSAKSPNLARIEKNGAYAVGTRSVELS
jgi:hypothetical protein